MTLRLALMGDSETEVTDGLALLAAAGVADEVRTPPRESSPGRWMATVTPKAPAGGEGLTAER